MKRLGMALVMLIAILSSSCGGKEVDPVRSKTVHKYRGGSKSPTTVHPVEKSGQTESLR